MPTSTNLFSSKSLSSRGDKTSLLFQWAFFDFANFGSIHVQINISPGIDNQSVQAGIISSEQSLEYQIMKGGKELVTLTNS